jgi:hypothetical protein
VGCEVRIRLLSVEVWIWCSFRKSRFRTQLLRPNVSTFCGVHIIACNALRICAEAND